MHYLVMIVTALLISAIGFKKFVWFISIGYGFSITGLGAVMMIMFYQNLTPCTIILGILCMIYGCRLSGYLLVREIKSASYQKTMKDEIKDGSSMKLILKIVIWISCAFLYCCMVAPIFFRLRNNEPTDMTTIVGTAIMVLGVILESAADFTKNRFKKKNPKRFCDVGLFRMVRCPNYLGEVLIWTGVFVSGVTALNSPLEWVLSILGYACIVYIMFGGARRLEIRQNKNYGNDPEYQVYVKKTPILIPLIPLYSVEKYKWLVG